MCDSLVTLDLKSPPQRVRIDVPNYPDMHPFVGAAMKAFAASMRDKSFERMPEGWDKLLEGYYEANGAPRPIYVDDAVPAFERWEGDKVLVCLTGGKDSALMLLEMIEERGKENVIGFYVDGLNRSEASYEREAAAAICAKHGVEYIQTKAQISGVKNRQGNMIGLRDQLITSAALVYARRVGAGSIAEGLHIEEGSERGPLWCESQSAVDIWTKLAGVELHCLNRTELDILDKMIDRYMDTLEITVSCYTQRNFRENQHARMVDKFPDSWVHPTGCGLCKKCLRIQGAVAYRRDDQVMLDYVMLRHQMDHPTDTTLRELHERIQGIA